MDGRLAANFIQTSFIDNPDTTTLQDCYYSQKYGDFPLEIFTGFQSILGDSWCILRIMLTKSQHIDNYECHE